MIAGLTSGIISGLLIIDINFLSSRDDFIEISISPTIEKVLNRSQRTQLDVEANLPEDESESLTLDPQTQEKIKKLIKIQLSNRKNSQKQRLLSSGESSVSEPSQLVVYETVAEIQQLSCSSEDAVNEIFDKEDESVRPL